MVFGYIFSSVECQDIYSEIDELNKYGVDEIRIDKTRNPKDRIQFKLLKNKLQNGDTLVLKRLNSLGRGKKQIKSHWKELKALGINIVVLDEQIEQIKAYLNIN